MASGGSDRQTGTVPKTKARNNCNVPQEVVTPTRRDIHSTNIMTTSVDWLPVSEHNTRPSQNKSRKPTNIPPDNEFAELDSSTAHEGGSRFVPVRPQPRTLVLRQRDNLMDNTEDNASYNSILGGHSPHTSHTAIMIVNPTTPNSNQSNQNMNSSGSGARNNMRGSSVGRDPSYANITGPVCSHPVTNNNPKPTNVSHDSHDFGYQNGTSQNYNNENVSQNQQTEHMLPRTDSIVAACTDTVRVEQRLGQIREYIRVTSTLVDSMRNSEDELRTRLTSLRRSNDLLMASVYQEPDEGPDSDVVELMETLDQLKDSEKKLEEILRIVDRKDDDNEMKSNRVNKPQPVEHETTESSKNQIQQEEESILKEWTQSDRGVIISEVMEEAGNKDLTNLSNQEGLPRPASAQSSVSAYSDNDLWQNELKANMEISQLRLAAALQEQKRLLKYQADAKEQLAEIHLARNGHMDNMGGSDHHEQGQTGQSNYHSGQQPLAAQAAGRVYGTNQIGVATTLPHVTEGNQHNNIHNWNNQGARKRASSSREREMNERTLSTVREPSEGRSKGVAVAVVSSDQAEIDMLRDLQMRRQHLESQTSQVAKIQNLHAATSSLADAVSCPPTIDGIGGGGGGQEGSRSGPAAWGGSEASEEEGGTIENTIRNKVAAVNVMKVELERLKSMLRTVDSIQNNFGINASFDDENIYDNTNSQMQQENHNRNRNRVSESSVNNIPLCRTDSSSSSKLMKDSQSGSQNSGANSKNQNTPLGLSRLQNCISSGSNKCTNVSEQNQSTGDSVGSGLAAIQQLTHELKQAAQGLSEERRRLKHATNRDICTSSGSSIKSEDKKRTNSISGGNTSTNTVVSYPAYSGPMERRQLALKAELEAKKKQLERLMSKDVDHRTNQQSLALEQSGPSKPTPPGADDAPLVLPNAVLAGAAAAEDDCACSTTAMRTDIDNGYSSDQDDDEAYLSSSRNQLNINQMGGGPSHKLPSRGSSIDNFKDTSYFDDSTQSLDGSFASQSLKHNKHQQSRTNMAATSSSSKQHNREPASSRTLLDLSQELQELTQRAAKEFHNAREAAAEGRGGEAHSQEREMTAPPVTDCFLTLPVSNNVNSSGRNKDVCDVSNVSNASSGSSSEGERDPIPPPMATLPQRHHRQLSKNNHDNSNPEMLPSQWHNPHSESQVTMWWHNKANQLQQQLEMTSNLCQSLLQDKRAGQMTPSTFNSSSQTTQVPNSILLPNYQNNSVTLPNQANNPVYPNYAANPMMFPNYPNNPMYLPNPGIGMPGMMLPNYGGADVMAPNLAGGHLWALQQQVAAAQQQQVAAAAWGSAHCIQHLLSQQREISSLRTTVSNLEEKLQNLNMSLPRAHSTPPHINFLENAPNAQGVRANSAQSNSQSQYWNIQSQTNQPNSDTSNTNPPIYPPFIPPTGSSNVHPSNLNQTRAPKVTPNIPPFPAEHFNNQLPANFSLPSNIYQSEQSGDQMSMPMTAHSNVAMTNQALFNNCTPPAQLNPNVLSNQSIPQPIQNNRNPNCLLNLTPHVAMNNPHPMGTQTLSGQSTALNNQVPPGNRANNYWDNFRSYSRQNLLSGSSKTNADPAFPTHSPHPLVERSHNTLHSSTPPAVLPSSQTTNTPKRNVNYPTGNAYSSGAQQNPQCDLSYDSAQRRGRRNLSQETEYFTAPPDVLNVNQNLDTEPDQLASHTEELSTVNRFHSSVNVNVNRLTTNPIPEIIQAHSNNLNVPRSNGAHKKKSSSKLPAKNASNSGNYSLDYVHNRNVETNVSSEIFNPNLAVTSSSNGQEKSTTKLFDLLRENVYSEVTALISANESRPHFLIQLFRDLQQISSDTLRQRALQSIQELVTHYLSAVETESYEANEDHRNMLRNPTANDNQGAAVISQSNETAILALDIDNEIVRFILAHHLDICSNELLESLRHVVMSTIGNHSEHSHLDRNLRDCFTKYQGCKLMDISDDLVITISRIISTVDTKNRQISSTATESGGDVAAGESSRQGPVALLSYQENAANDRHFAQLLLENSEIEAANKHMEGLACAASMINNQNEVMGLYTSPCSSTHDASDRFVGMPDSKIDLIENVETYNGDLAEADQSRHGSETTAASGDGVLEGLLPDVVDTEEQTPTEAEAEWLGLDRVPTRLQIEDNPGNQSDSSQA